MRGPGYNLVTDLLVAAGHTREQASAAVARIEWDVLDWAQGTVDSTGLHCPDGTSDNYVDGWYDGSVAAKARLAEHAERARVEARRGGIAVPPGPTPPDPAPVVPAPANPGQVLGTARELFAGLVGEQPHDDETTDAVFDVIQWLFDGPDYTATLTGFVRDRERDLRAMYRDYGHGTSHDRDPDGWPGPRYVLVRQPENLALAELLTRRPLALAQAWNGTLPDVLLDDMATAWPHRS
ncbi:hypothetical protein [Kitasatospora sp. NPDC057223]|uniref:hypothetical protein n=1 Tax=Kitasatospora sp. NPDC057223 TaxID=3346055 RepID=UPI00363A7956